MHLRLPSPRLRPVRRAVAAAALAVLALPNLAHAVVVITGTGFTQPGSVPGHDLIWVGDGFGNSGAIEVSGGATPTVGALYLGWNRANASGLVAGPGTVLTLDTVGSGGARLSVGHWGTADLTVRGGARILADSTTGCTGFCGASVGSFAGTTGRLLIQDIGSLVRIRDPLYIATAGVDLANGFGTVGGHTTGTVEVLSGGQLATAGGLSGSFNNNRPDETSLARITVADAGSLWSLSPGPNAAAPGPVFTLSNSVTNQSFLTVANGGEVRVSSADVAFAGFNVGNNGGNGRITVSGPGSKLQFNGESTFINLANSNGATGTMTVDTGASVQGLFYLGIGRNGGVGNLVVDGAGSVLSLNGVASQAANGASALAAFEIGRNGGIGQATVGNGGRIVLSGNQARTNRLTLALGRDISSTGVLKIAGAGSEVLLQVASVVAGGGPSESFNPLMNVGRDGHGLLDISAGGALRLVGNAVSAPGAARDTTLNIGGLSDTATSGRGTASVSGAGSLLSVTGGDASIRVGRGPGGMGELSITNQGTVETTILGIGRAGQGSLLLDNGNLHIGGRFGSNAQVTANLGIGNLGGTGIATLRKQSRVVLDTPEGVGVYLGGTGLSLQGTGILNVSGGSSITINAAPGNARFIAGYDGTGIASFDNSTLSMADGRLSVASQPGSAGILRLSNGSVVTTGWAGVGRDRLLDGTVTEGGVAQLIINDSTFNAGTLEIGTKGYLGGSNGTVVGNVINSGVINPGNSPGTLVIDGSFVNATGGRIVLEVEADGSGGFVTDHLVFAQGSQVNLAGASITFSFLGSTDPTAFQASGGFDIDRFITQRTAQGDVALGDAAFSGVQFGAESPAYTISNFSYSAAAGAQFTAAPVPEPATNALLLAGVLGLGWLARRRRAA